MPQINVLSKEISELIAAGEVIERPSSVIKELVENSIDSGARHITVEVKNGGTMYMRVTDDGCGMAFDDVPKAFLRNVSDTDFNTEDYGQTNHHQNVVNQTNQGSDTGPNFKSDKDINEDYSPNNCDSNCSFFQKSGCCGTTDRFNNDISTVYQIRIL